MSNHQSIEKFLEYQRKGGILSNMRLMVLVVKWEEYAKLLSAVGTSSKITKKNTSKMTPTARPSQANQQSQPSQANKQTQPSLGSQACQQTQATPTT